MEETEVLCCLENLFFNLSYRLSNKYFSFPGARDNLEFQSENKLK